MKQGWELKKINEVCEIRPPKKEAKELISDNDLVSFVPMKTLGIDQKFFITNETKKLSDVSGSYTYFKNNDVLLAKITPCFENGKLGIASKLCNSIGFGSSEFIVYRPSDKVVSEYLYYFLNQQSFRDRGKAVMTGAVGHKRIPKDFYEEFLIPIPPIEEQKKIVENLDEAFEAIDQAQANIKKNIENAQELFQSKLNDIFSQKGEGWEEKSIEEVSNVINGYSFKSKDFSPDNEIKSIKITNVGIRSFVEDTSNNLPKHYLEEYAKVKVNKGDIVIALTRTIISDGLKVARVPNSYNHSLLNQRVAAIIPDSNIVDGSFLYRYLSSKIVYDYVLSNVNTLMQPNLSIKDLKRLKVPLTCVDEQIQISKKIEGFEILSNLIIDKYERKLTNLEDLKKSILQKAFAGELTNNQQATIN